MNNYSKLLNSEAIKRIKSPSSFCAPYTSGLVQNMFNRVLLGYIFQMTWLKGAEALLAPFSWLLH